MNLHDRMMLATARSATALLKSFGPESERLVRTASNTAARAFTGTPTDREVRAVAKSLALQILSAFFASAQRVSAEQLIEIGQQAVKEVANGQG